MHPGCATGHKTTTQDPTGKLASIKKLATILTKILKKEDKVQILLENTAYANRSIGSNITDFKTLLDMLEDPNKINFCLDLAHAFAYGYNLEKINDFILFIDKNMGLEKIKLIHLQDCAYPRGSRIDKHQHLGKGFIGIKPLKEFIQHPKIKNIPIILELPNTEKNEVKNSLKTVFSW